MVFEKQKNKKKRPSHWIVQRVHSLAGITFFLLLASLFVTLILFLCNKWTCVLVHASALEKQRSLAQEKGIC